MANRSAPFLLLLLLAACSQAWAAADGELRDALRDVYKAAAEERDVWTMLQLEAWCEANEVRQRNQVFGKARIIGSPLFGTPDGIAYLHDRGDVLLVVGPRRLHQWSADGRPLRPSMAIPNGCNLRAASHDGRYVFIGDYVRDEEEKVYRVRSCIVDAHERRIVRRHEFDLPADHSNDYTAAIADDGSAAMICFMARANVPASADCLYLLRRDKKDPERITKLVNPRAVGTKGEWYVAREAQHPSRMLLITGDKRIPLHRYIDGPGNRLAFIDDQHTAVQIIDERARIHTLKLPFAITEHSDLIDAGAWLAIDSRGESRSVETTDIFGNTSTEHVGGQHAFFAWSDLGGGKPKPRLLGDGILALDYHRPGGLLTWQDGLVERLHIDPDQDPPLQRSTLLKLDDARVTWVGCEDWHYQLSLSVQEENAKGKLRAVNRSAIANLDGDVIWRGPKRRLECLGHNRALAVKNWDEPDSFELLMLAGDSSKTISRPLKMAAGKKQDRFDAYGRRIYLSDELWYEIDGRDGQLLGAYDRERHKGFNPEYTMPWDSDHPSRFMFAGARLIPKQLPTDSRIHLDPRWMQFSDALQVPGGVVATTSSDELLLFGRRDDEPQVLGRLPRPEADLKQAKGLDLAIVDTDRKQLLGWLERGKNLKLPDEARELPDVDPEPEGSWKVDHMHFDLGRYGAGDWPDAAGFRPRRLRSHSDARSLLIVTRSCIVEIEQRDMARFLAMFDK